MNARRLLFAIVLAACALAAPAGAVEIAFEGAITIQIGLYPKQIVIPGGGVADASLDGNGRITRIDMPAGLFVAQTLIIPVTDPSAAPIRGFFASGFANETGVFVRDAEDRLNGSMPLMGNIKVCLFGDCTMAVANLTVPASVIGHVATDDLPGAVNLTTRGAPWTTGRVDATPDPVTGSDAGTELSLVTPIFISTSISAFAVVKSYGVLDLSIASLAGDHCQNGFDDDGDGVADYPNDPGCSSPEDESERTEGAPCDDGIDNDGDLRIDAADPGCDGPADASERAETLACDNGLDDDGDGLVEPDDPGCAGAADPSERGAGACDDGLDTDGDGLVEPFDPGCSGPTDVSERGPDLVCDNGEDDDGDGVPDFPGDEGCTSIVDPNERTASRICDNGVDDDGDGRRDFRVSGTGDPGCSSTADTSEKSALLACDDGLDNDFDGASDVPDDPGCANPGDVSEQAPFLPCDNGLDDDEDGAIDSQQDAGCTHPFDLRESVDFADGGYWGISVIESVADHVWVEDGPEFFTALDVLSGGVIGGDLTASGASFVRLRGGTVEGSLFARDAAAVEILRGAIGGAIEARDASVVTIFGSGFDLPLGAVAATSGTLAGFLTDGTPFVWDFARDAGASIVLAPEAEAIGAALAAMAALGVVRHRR